MTKKGITISMKKAADYAGTDGLLLAPTGSYTDGEGWTEYREGKIEYSLNGKSTEKWWYAILNFENPDGKTCTIYHQSNVSAMKSWGTSGVFVTTTGKNDTVLTRDHYKIRNTNKLPSSIKPRIERALNCLEKRILAEEKKKA